MRNITVNLAEGMFILTNLTSLFRMILERFPKNGNTMRNSFLATDDTQITWENILLKNIRTHLSISYIEYLFFRKIPFKYSSSI